MSDRDDVVIVGGGAAGFTAGIYAARDRCRALLVSHQEAYGFPDRHQVFAKIDALREQVR